MQIDHQAERGDCRVLCRRAAGDRLGRSRNELTPQEKARVEGTSKEGAVTLLNPIFNDRTGERLGQAFIKRYNLGAGFRFNNLRKGTGQTVAQVRQEIVANKFTVDILLVSAPAFFDEAAKRGAFMALDSGYWKNHADLAKQAGQYANYPYVVVPFAYSFQPVWNSSCPGMANFSAATYDDVVRPELKGKTIASDLTKSITYPNPVHGSHHSQGLRQHPRHQLRLDGRGHVHRRVARLDQCAHQLPLARAA